MYRMYVLQHIGGKWLTIEWLQEVLQARCGERRQLQSYEARRIGVGKGFLARILRVGLDWADEPDAAPTQLPASVVLKIPTSVGPPDALGAITQLVCGADDDAPVDEHSLQQADDAPDHVLPVLHRKECLAYEWLRNASVAIPRIYLTQVAGGDNPGVIIMEDLSAIGSTVDLAEGLNLNQMFAIVNALVDVHVTCFTWDESWTQKIPMLPDAASDISEEMFQVVKEGLLKLDGDAFAKIDLVKELFCSNRKQMAIESPDRLGITPVLVHGDMWANNIVFKNENPDELLAILDWQAVHSGSCTEDLCRLLVTSTVAAVRRAEADGVLAYYHEQLSERFDGDPPFSLVDVRRAYDDSLPFAMTFFLTGLQYMANQEKIVRDDGRLEMIERGRCILEDVIQMTFGAGPTQDDAIAMVIGTRAATIITDEQGLTEEWVEKVVPEIEEPQSIDASYTDEPLITHEETVMKSAHYEEEAEMMTGEVATAPVSEPDADEDEQPTDMPEKTPSIGGRQSVTSQGRTPSASRAASQASSKARSVGRSSQQSNRVQVEAGLEQNRDTDEETGAEPNAAPREQTPSIAGRESASKDSIHQSDRAASQASQREAVSAGRASQSSAKAHSVGRLSQQSNRVQVEAGIEQNGDMHEETAVEPNAAPREQTPSIGGRESANEMQESDRAASQASQQEAVSAAGRASQASAKAPSVGRASQQSNRVNVEGGIEQNRDEYEKTSADRNVLAQAAKTPSIGGRESANEMQESGRGASQASQQEALSGGRISQASAKAQSEGRASQQSNRVPSANGMEQRLDAEDDPAPIARLESSASRASQERAASAGRSSQASGKAPSESRTANGVANEDGVEPTDTSEAFHLDDSDEKMAEDTPSVGGRESAVEGDRGASQVSQVAVVSAGRASQASTAAPAVGRESQQSTKGPSEARGSKPSSRLARDGRQSGASEQRAASSKRQSRLARSATKEGRASQMSTTDSQQPLENGESDSKAADEQSNGQQQAEENAEMTFENGDGAGQGDDENESIGGDGNSEIARKKAADDQSGLLENGDSENTETQV